LLVVRIKAFENHGNALFFVVKLSYQEKADAGNYTKQNKKKREFT
jgi:hypothetical protein